MTGSRPAEGGGGIARWYAFVRPLILLGAVAYLVVRIASGWPVVRDVSLRWSSFELAASALSGAAALFCLPVGWLVLLRRAGWYQARHRGVYQRIWWISYLCRYVPGKVLVLVERGRMGRRVGIPASAGATLAVIETLLAILAAGWVSLLAVAYHAGPRGGALWLIGVLSLVILVGMPVTLRLVARLPFVQRRFPDLDKIGLGSRDYLAAMPWFVMHFLLLGLSLFLLARCVHPFEWRDLPGLTGVYAVSQVVGLSTMVAPAGLGVREGVLGVQLARVLPAGLAEAVAVGARLWFTLIELVALGAVLLFAPPLPAAEGAGDAQTVVE